MRWVTFNRYTDTSTHRVFTHMNHFSDNNSGSDDDEEPPRKRPYIEGSPRAERSRAFILLAARDARDRATALIDNLAVCGDRDKYDETGTWRLARLMMISCAM